MQQEVVWDRAIDHRKVSKQNRRAKAMSKRSKRIALILVGVAMALLAAAQYFGWTAGPPPLLAPGIRFPHPSASGSFSNAGSIATLSDEGYFNDFLPIWTESD